MQGCDEFPAFWLRGLVPWEWTFGRVEEEFDLSPIRVQLYGPWASGVWALPANAVAATDGSGGPNSRDPRLRRVGWGAVVSNGRLEPIAWASGGVEGPQTVPRSELQAVLWLVSHTSGDVVVYVDAKYRKQSVQLTASSVNC